MELSNSEDSTLINYPVSFLNVSALLNNMGAFFSLCHETNLSQQNNNQKKILGVERMMNISDPQFVDSIPPHFRKMYSKFK